MGHVGLTESAQAVAPRALGWDASGTTETIEPGASPRCRLPSAFGTIEPGRIAGIDQVAVVVADGVERVRLHLQMAVGIGPSQDDIWLTGDPDLHLRSRVACTATSRRRRRWSTRSAASGTPSRVSG